MVKGGQWHTVDNDLWTSIAALHLQFDYENSQPSCLIGIWLKTPIRQKGRPLAYYEEASSARSESEQESAAQILAYLDGMKSSAESADGADRSIEIIFSDKKNGVERRYICYDLQDESGNCIVKYEGERAAAQAGYSGGGWLAAGPGFYTYLESIL